jgi:hypothetical protein
MVLPIEAHISTAGWQPAGISDYVSLTWNHNGTLLNVGETVQTALTLSISYSNLSIDYITASNPKYCSFNITLSAFSRLVSITQNTFVNTPTGEQVNTQILPQISGCGLQFVYRDTDYERRENCDLAPIFSYVPENASHSTVFVTVVVGDSISKIKGWNLTDVGMPDTNVTIIDSKSIRIIQTPSIVGSYLAFRFSGADNQTQLVAFWDEIGLFKIGTAVQQRYFQISLIAYPSQDSDIAELESELLATARAIASYWQYESHIT